MNSIVTDVDAVVAAAARPPKLETYFPAEPVHLARLVARFALHPELDIHPSWLPANWPPRFRRPERFGVRGQAVLADWLHAHTPRIELDFSEPIRRLLLVDGPTLRRLAFYCSFCAHAPLLEQRGPVARRLRRQMQRIDDDARDFVLGRTPRLPAFAMDASAIERRPASAGRVLTSRGYRLLRGVVALQGDAVLHRLERKLPRAASFARAPQLTDIQANQLSELIQMCLIPERFAQWDWLF